MKVIDINRQYKIWSRTNLKSTIFNQQIIRTTTTQKMKQFSEREREKNEKEKEEEEYVEN